MTQQPRRSLLSPANPGSLKHLHPWRRGQPLTAGQGRSQAPRAAAAGQLLNPVLRLKCQTDLARADKLQQQPARLSALGLGRRAAQKRQMLHTVPAQTGHRLDRHLIMKEMGTRLGPAPLLLCWAQQQSLLLMPQKWTWRALRACCLLGRSSSGRFTPSESKGIGSALGLHAVVTHKCSTVTAPLCFTQSDKMSGRLLCHTVFCLNDCWGSIIA